LDIARPTVQRALAEIERLVSAAQPSNHPTGQPLR
jgi:hypothetical protein